MVFLSLLFSSFLPPSSRPSTSALPPRTRLLRASKFALRYDHEQNFVASLSTSARDLCPGILRTAFGLPFAKMSETYDTYERQYFELSDKISRKCVASAVASGEEKKQMLVEIKNGLDDAESLIRRMDLEARNMPPTQKATLLAGLRAHKADLTNLKREAKKTLATRDSTAARDELLEGGMADTIALSSEQRGRLLTSTERLNQSGDRIRESKRTLLETESLGVSILSDLHSQRQTLLHARSTMHEVDDNIGKSRRILLNMTRLINRNKWIGWGIIIVLIFLVILILYVKFTR